jgi:preprotein translocase subunit SecF
MKDISLVRILPQEPRVPFINLRMIAAAFSVLAIIASIFLFTTKGLNYGIDFTGGTVIEINTSADPDDAAIRAALIDLGYDGATVQGIQPPVGALDQQGNPITHRLMRIGIQLADESGEAGQGAQQDALG